MSKEVKRGRISLEAHVAFYGDGDMPGVEYEPCRDNSNAAALAWRAAHARPYRGVAERRAFFLTAAEAAIEVSGDRRERVRVYHRGERLSLPKIAACGIVAEMAIFYALLWYGIASAYVCRGRKRTKSIQGVARSARAASGRRRNVQMAEIFLSK